MYLYAQSENDSKNSHKNFDAKTVPLVSWHELCNKSVATNEKWYPLPVTADKQYIPLTSRSIILVANTFT